jgi:hypothetical protein
MKTIISEYCPLMSIMKEETSNDLLVHKILKKNDYDLSNEDKDSDQEGT